MSRYKHYLDIDVVTAARERVSHVYDIFDSIVVQFSGGKDSQVVLELVREEATKRGKLPVEAVFRDEELIPAAVVDHVDWYRQQPWLNLRWLCLQIEVDKFSMGHREMVRWWDPNRKWARPMPPWAISKLDGIPENVAVPQTMLDEALIPLYRGKIAFATGIRASESIIRYRSCVNKLNENYIVIAHNASPLMRGRSRLVKPIYDWEEDDVLQYLAGTEKGWTPFYDRQLLGKHGLRVSSELHVESSKRIGMLRAIDPDLYENIIEGFPEMMTMEKYYRDFDEDAVIAKYEPEGWDGCKRFITEMMDERIQEQAFAFLKSTQKLARNDKNITIRTTLEHLLKNSVERLGQGGMLSRSMSDSSKSKTAKKK